MKYVKGIDTLEGKKLKWDGSDIGTYGYYKSPKDHTGPVGDWISSHKEIVNNLDRKNVCVQAGGAMGLYPLLLSSIFNEVYTFEPYQPSYFLIEKNVEDLGIKNVWPLWYALGDADQKGQIKVNNRKNLGMNQVELNPNGEVFIKKLDSFEWDCIDFLWLDIEGYEFKALKGAENCIDQHKPVIALEAPSPDCIDFLKRFGYERTEKSAMDIFFYPAAA